MKVIAWNCNMAFRKKAGYILAHQPDILIIPECEHPDKLKFDADIPAPTDIIWYGTEAQIMEQFFAVRYMIKSYSQNFVQDHLSV